MTSARFPRPAAPLAPVLVLALALASWLGACAGGEPRSITVLAASSLKEPFARLAAGFEQRRQGVKVRLAFAGSQEIRTQLEHGGRADVIATADPRPMAALAAAGLVEPPVTFAENLPVLAVPAGNPGRIAGLEDLPAARRIVLGAPGVPIGAYANEILDRASGTLGAGFRARVEARVVSRELNVRQIAAKLALGEADAGFVYATDAAAFAGRLEIVPLPERLEVRARYPIALVREAADPALGRAFVEAVLSASGRAILAEAGFRAPAPAAAPGAGARP